MINKYFRLVSAVARTCSPLVAAFQKLVSFDTRQYHPERYFMRGPGPAWRAKHASDRNSAS